MSWSGENGYLQEINLETDYLNCMWGITSGELCSFRGFICDDNAFFICVTLGNWTQMIYFILWDLSSCWLTVELCRPHTSAELYGGYGQTSQRFFWPVQEEAAAPPSCTHLTEHRTPERTKMDCFHISSKTHLNVKFMIWIFKHF